MAVARQERTRLTPEERRQQIVYATVSALAAYGPQECTLRKVAREMGVAPSLITYFFSTWADLLRQTYGHLTDSFDAVIRDLALGTSPRAAEDIARYLDATFSEAWTCDRIGGAHISLWALARGDVDLSADMDRTTHNLRKQTRDLIARLIEERDGAARPDKVNNAFYALISGLWFEMTVNPGTITRQEAIATAWDFLDAAVPDPRGEQA